MLIQRIELISFNDEETFKTKEDMIIKLTKFKEENNTGIQKDY